MINIEISEKAIKTIDRVLLILRERCEQFFLFIYSTTIPNQEQHRQIEKALVDFTEISCKKQFEKMASDVLNKIHSRSHYQQDITQLQNFINGNLQQLIIESQQQSPKSFVQNKMFQHFKDVKKLLAFIYDQMEEEDMNQNKKLKHQLEDQQLNSLLLQLNQSYSTQLIKKKKRKGKQSLFQIKVPKEYKLNILKYLHYLRIIRMKEKYSQVQIKLFKEQKQKLWFFKLTNQEIYQMITRSNKYKLDQMKNQFRSWRKYLEKRFYNIEQSCLKHYSKVFYLCLEEIEKEKIYLCNQCINDKMFFQHHKHQIICKRHRKQIKFRSRSQQQMLIDEQNYDQRVKGQRKQQQIFKCEQCIYYDTDKKYNHISCCHYLEISQLCIQQNCIMIDNFMICPQCQQQNHKHQNHKKIKFNRNSLIEHYTLQRAIDITYYEQELIKAKDMLKLNPLQKIRISYAEKISQTIRFLQSFAVYNNQGVNKWIDCILTEAKREDLMVLKGLLKIKQTFYSEGDRLKYLDIFNTRIQKELQVLFQQIWKKLQNCCQRIKQLENIDRQTLTLQLKRKYGSITNIEVENKIIQSPKSMRNINPIFYSVIQKIKVVKQRDNQKDQIIKRQWKDKRSRFFQQQLRRILIQRQIKYEVSRKIVELFINAEENYSEGSLSINLDQLGELKLYTSLIISLKQSFQMMNKQFRLKQRQCLQWQYIVLNQFTSIKFVYIQYISKEIKQQDLSQYCISAFELLKFIFQNQSLQQVIIKGVQIQKINQVILSLNHKQQQRWLIKFQQKKTLRISLNFTYYFDLKAINSCIINFMNFRNYFYELGEISFRIDSYNFWWGDTLEKLMLCLRSVKKIKLFISCQDITFKQLLSGLSSFTQITSLELQQIRFSQLFTQTSFSSLESSLACLFSNNIIKKLSIRSCRNFPALPRVTTLESLSLDNVHFRDNFDLNEFIRAGNLLKIIKFQQLKQRLVFPEQMVSRLDYLKIKWWRGVSFNLYSNHSPYNLKHLSLIQCNIQKECLQHLLANLTTLLKLQLQLLSAIPSPYLEEITICRNSTLKDHDLQLIDSKWPYLREITLRILQGSY